MITLSFSLLYCHTFHIRTCLLRFDIVVHGTSYLFCPGLQPALSLAEEQQPRTPASGMSDHRSSSATCDRRPASCWQLPKVAEKNDMDALQNLQLSPELMAHLPPGFLPGVAAGCGRVGSSSRLSVLLTWLLQPMKLHFLTAERR